MSDDQIDAIVAEAAAPVAGEKAADQSLPEGQAEDDQAKQADDAAGEDSQEVFPKKALNALSKRDKKIGKLQAQVAALLAEKASWSGGQPQNQATQSKQSNGSQPPKEEDFDSYGDFLAAKTEYQILQKLSEQQQARQKEETSQRELAAKQEWIESRDEEIGRSASEYAKQIPDFMQVLQECSALSDSMPPHIVELFYEADDTAMAIYNLAKEGKIERLASMSPMKAAIEIDRAGSRVPQVKKVSSAPEPMKGASGAQTQGARRLEDLSGEEIIKRLNIR